MNIKGAISETMVLAGCIDPRRVKFIAMYHHHTLGYKHLCEMRDAVMREDMDDLKLSRYLGWMQCAIVSWGGDANLETMKDINRRHVDAVQA